MRLIGFVGLGTMGFAMAENLCKHGYELIVYNRSRSRAEELAAGRPSVTVAETPKQVAQEAEVILTMVGDDASVKSVYFGENGILSGLAAGKTAIDSSTVSPALSRRLARAVEERLADFLDAPVAGSKPAAETGTLTFMAGGRADVLESVRDVLLAMGRGVVHMGPSGAGAQAKLAHNLIVGANAAALSEGLALAVKAGVDPAKFLDVVASGGAASKYLELKRDKLLGRDFSNQFSLKFLLKDLRLASALADELGVPSPVLSGAKSLFQTGAARGLGELDFSSVIQCYEEWTGVRIEGGKEAAERTEQPEQTPSAPSASPQDRRRAQRVTVNIPLLISIYQWEQEGSFTGQQIEATLYDLSEDGLQVVSSFPWPRICSSSSTSRWKRSCRRSSAKSSASSPTAKHSATAAC